MASAPLPREIIKWLQSLDLSFVLKNPKRDLTNGYLTAEIVSRYFPKDVNMMNFENGTRLAAKTDNWEQLYKFFKKKGIAMTKQDFDPVIHCAPGAAHYFILKLYQLLTKKAIKAIMPESRDGPLPAYMRDTASHRLKDHEIDRVQDRVERTFRAIDTLGAYHEERRVQKAMEAPILLRHERHLKARRPGQDLEMLSREIGEDSVQVDEVRVKALQGDSTQLRQAPGGRQGNAQPGAPASFQSTLIKKVSTTRSAVGALAAMAAPALFVKPAMDIMRPLVQSIIQESEDLVKVIDSRKDIVVSFMEQCREGKFDEETKSFKYGVPEEVSVRVFDTLANRAQLLVESLTRSPPEFWKVWSTFYPALTDFPEQSAIFESAVYLFKRLGDLMRDQDPTLTQQLITEVGLPSLSKELCRSPEKREALCAIVYSYTQEDTLNHLLVLRALKEKISDLPVYISCLSCLISRDAQLSLLDDYLLDLYIYYALMAMQSPQPKVRVAGLSILSTIAMCSSQHQSVVALIPGFVELANDEWWEVQAQLILLSASLLSKISSTERQDAATEGDGESATGNLDSPVSAAPGKESTMLAGEDGAPPGAMDDVTAQLEAIIGDLFVVSNSKNVLQVGLSALVQLLDDLPHLQPMFMAVLLEQPLPLRQRLLRPMDGADQAPSGHLGKLTYVWGTSTREYEEKCISALWPHLDMAKTFVKQQETHTLDNWEMAHTEVFLATLPEVFKEAEGEEWLALFEKIKQYIFVALVDPNLHLLSTRIIKKFWLCNVDIVASRSIEGSTNTLLQALRLLYRDMGIAKVDEQLMLDFLKDLWNRGGTVKFEIESVITSFQENQPTEYAASKLYTILA
jgi:hypothetical protein